MESVFSTWLALGLLSIVAEFFIGSTYGFGVGFAAFCAAAVAYFTGATDFHLVQFIVFATISALCAYTFPHLFKKYMGGEEKTYISPLESLVGKTVAIKQVGTTWKIEVDGVDYPLEMEDKNATCSEGQKVVVKNVSSGTLIVE